MHSCDAVHADGNAVQTYVNEEDGKKEKEKKSLFKKKKKYFANLELRLPFPILRSCGSSQKNKKHPSRRVSRGLAFAGESEIWPRVGLGRRVLVGSKPTAAVDVRSYPGCRYAGVPVCRHEKITEMVGGLSTYHFFFFLSMS